MAITGLHVGRRVRWTDRGITYSGTLHRVPEPGTHPWWRDAGRSTIRDDAGHYHLVWPADLELDEEVTADG